MKKISLAILTFVSLAAPPTASKAQQLDVDDDLPLSGRWVGQRRVRALWLEFYADTMLVVNDRYALQYRVTSDSLLAFGDTTITASYRMSHGWLLLHTPEGEVITMSPQTALARPLRGRWLGEVGGEDRSPAQLQLSVDGTARWRYLPQGAWVVGEWDRSARNLTFLWEPDSTQWFGLYDAEGNSILFRNTVEESLTSIFRRWIR